MTWLRTNMLHIRQFLLVSILLNAVLTGAVVGLPTLAHASAATGLPAVADLAEQHSAAVVNVSTTSKPKPMMDRTFHQFEGQTPFEGTPFEDFFKDFFRHSPMQNMPVRSLGSGVLISADGYVLTNNHVVDGADDIVVRLQDEHEFKAKIVGRDSKNDLALLKIDGKNLPYVTLGDSDKVRVGEWVVAIGNPFGLGGTVTAGIISARGRHIGQGPYDDFLQTDAAINPGNSGGPLFNMQGEVIGINTAILSRSGGSQGIGFSIPSNTAKLIVDQLKTYGHAIRGWLGVRIQTVTSDMAEALGRKESGGALVAEVVSGSPAAKAGLKSGDLIVKYDDQDIRKMVDLPRLVAETEVGKTVPLAIVRNGKKMTLKTTIAELKEDDKADTSAADKAPDAVPSDAPLGMQLKDMTDDLRQQYQVDDKVKGVIVTGLNPDGPAAAAGVKVGDVILRVNRTDVTTARAATKLIKQDKGAAVLLLLNREGGNTFVPVRRQTSDDSAE